MAGYTINVTGDSNMSKLVLASPYSSISDADMPHPPPHPPFPKADMLFAYNKYQYVDGSGGLVNPSLNIKPPQILVNNDPSNNNQIFSYIYDLIDPKLVNPKTGSMVLLPKTGGPNILNWAGTLFNLGVGNNAIMNSTTTIRTNNDSQLVCGSLYINGPSVVIGAAGSVASVSVVPEPMDIISATGEFEGAKSVSIDYQDAANKNFRGRIITVKF